MKKQKMKKILTGTAAAGAMILLSAQNAGLGYTPFLDYNALFAPKFAESGQVDNTGALAAAMKYACSFDAININHVFRHPTIQVGNGNYLFNASAALPLPCTGLYFKGQGSVATTFTTATPNALFSVNAFDPAPSTYFPTGNLFSYGFSGIAFYNTASITETQRQGIAIQDNGGGGALIEDVLFYGWRMGFSASYGSDFDVLRDVEFESNDVGAYFGPGSQQVVISGTRSFGTFYSNVQGLVLEGIGGFDCYSCEFINNGRSGSSAGGPVTIQQNAVGEKTLAGVTILSNPTINSPKNFWSPWLESNAGGLGHLPKFWFNFTGDYAADTQRGLYISHAKIVAGGTVVSGSALIGNSQTSLFPQKINLDSPTLVGTELATWFSGITHSIYGNINVITGTTLLPIQTGSSAIVDDTTYEPQSEPSAGYWSKGTLVPLSSPTIGAGKVCSFWVRLTDGTATLANVDGTDWSQLCGTTT